MSQESERKVSELIAPEPPALDRQKSKPQANNWYVTEHWTPAQKQAWGVAVDEESFPPKKVIVPRPWLTDAWASEELLEMIPQPRLSRHPATKEWCCYEAPADKMQWHPDRKTAIALAFIAWKTAPTRSREG